MEMSARIARANGRLKSARVGMRHAWAIRTAIFGWPVELAARQMGHSVDMHTRTYHRWLSREHQQRVYDLLVNRPDRPYAPYL